VLGDFESGAKIISQASSMNDYFLSLVLSMLTLPGILLARFLQFGYLEPVLAVLLTFLIETGLFCDLKFIWCEP